MILPQTMMTEWYWSGSLHAFARVCSQRLDPHTQEETQVIAQGINDYCAELYPHSWRALMMRTAENDGSQHKTVAA